MKKSGKQKGMALVEVVISLALLVIVMTVVTTVLYSASRLGGRALSQMNYNNVKNNVEIALEAKETDTALSFYFGRDIPSGEETVIYFDNGFMQVSTADEAAYELHIYVDSEVKYARIFEIDGGSELWKTEG